ncbi:conserved hypothetical protein [Candidatus Nitrotoga sp. BS]|uniref:hypothetical protein n=1 Tax=Candidatus Nitrotoga sp. BS TaxID=2890408 RepID=UPI001EF36459|nr:hypothetical protein [Candidatus Nitrotoga sp. BS]CAH1194385.1 conserved hypothetical protein [Candidatus Nitrotoga sp. BS]
MFQFPESVSSILAGLSIAMVGGWIASFIAFRKDERSVQLSQITEERKKWRDNMRKLSAEISALHIENKTTPSPSKVAALRSVLATSINPKDITNDGAILDHYDRLFSADSDDLSVFNHRIALLLKHDWERVKWECMPLYLKPFFRYFPKQREWREKNYREVG